MKSGLPFYLLLIIFITAHLALVLNYLMDNRLLGEYPKPQFCKDMAGRELKYPHYNAEMARWCD